MGIIKFFIPLINNLSDLTNKTQFSQMLNFTQKIIENFSNKVSTLSFTGGSNLLSPVLHGEGSINGSHLPKSLYLGDTELSTESNVYSESVIEENLAKSRRSKESIEVKRSIIKKMSEKILMLEKKSKNQKMDIFELEACKNDLLLDFLEYQQSKRKHQQELAERQDDFQNEEKSFFFMKNELRETQQQQKTRKTVSFTKKQSKSTAPVQQQITDIKVTPIQILIPMIKMIDIEIPMLNLGEHKIRQTGTTLPTKLGDDCFAGISNQVNSVYHMEIEENCREQNLPLNSSRSGLSLNEARMMELGTERSDQSINYRQDRLGRRSDRFFIEEEDLIKNLREKEEINYNQLTERRIYDCHESEQKMDQSFDKVRNKSFNCSIKQSILLEELKLNSQVSEKQSSKYQEKRRSIDNQTKDFYRNKISELQQELRQKAETIGSLLKQNQQFVRQINQMNSRDERKEREIQGANMKVQMLQERVQEMQKYVKQVQETAQQTSTKLMNEIYQLSSQVQSKNQQLSLMMDSMQVIQQNAYNKQKDLMKEIQTLQNTIHRLKDEIEFYKKRFQQQGIKLNFTQIEMIEQAIQDRQKMYETNIEKLKGLYESELSQLKKKFSTLQGQAKQLQEKNNCLSVESETKSKFIQTNSFMAVKEQNIREIMDLYDGELETRDQQIIQLKEQLAHCNMALLEAIRIIRNNHWDQTQNHRDQTQNHRDQIQNQQKNTQTQDQQENKESIIDQMRTPHDQMVIQILTEKNRTLEERLAQQLKNRQEMTQKLLKLQKMILEDSSPTSGESNPLSAQKIDQDSRQYELIQALTQQLDSVMKQLQKQKQSNKRLKQQLNEQRPCSPTSQAKQIRQLKDKLHRLTKYSQVLQKQIREIYKVDQCEAHQKIIDRLQNKLKAGHGEYSSNKVESIMRLAQ